MPTLIKVEVPASENLKTGGFSTEMSQSDVYGQLKTKSTNLSSCRRGENLHGKDQNETTFDDSATVLSKNLLGDESTLPYGEESYDDRDETNIDDSSTILSNTVLGDHDKNLESTNRLLDSYEQSNLDDSMTIILDTPSQMPEESLLHKISKIGLEHPNSQPIQARSIDPRIIMETSGPHQARYQRKYQNYVQSTIHGFKKRFPNKIREYHDLSLEEKKQAQLHVVDLLARLRIGSASGQNETGRSHVECVKHGAKATPERKTQDQILSPGESPIWRKGAAEESFCHIGCSPLDHSNFDMSNADNSQAAISTIQPSSVLSGQSMKKSQVAFSRSNLDTGLNVSNASVELVRASESMSFSSNAFESPEHPRTNPSKRAASTSGKRGADLLRRKPNDGFSPNRFKDNTSESTELRLSNRMERLSISPASLSEPRDLFVASQSPISPGLTQRSSDSLEYLENDGTQISWEEGSDSESKCGDSVESLDTSLGYTRQCARGHRKMLRELPVNVQLKQGARIHLNKLEVKHATPQKKEVRRKDKNTRRYRLVHFADPFQRYSGKQSDCLDTVYDWINRSRGHDNDNLASIVFSLSFSHIVAVTLKILLHDARRTTSKENHSTNDNHGQTILVVRTKEDAAKWESALREGTGCSVLNHSTLPLSERIRKSTADKAAAHDVVLTTFDALKSPDVAIPMDEFGHAIVGSVDSSKGWYSSRSASQQDITPQACKQFSVLHRINFERIIFVDMLGRKCFLGKEGTARAAAATALQAESRYVAINRRVTS
jgi:hypothetical protein